MQSNMGGANHFKEVRAGVAEKWLASHAGTSPVDGRSSDQSKDSSRSASDDSKRPSSDEGIDSYRIAAGAIPVTPVTFRGTLQSAPQPDPKLLQQFHNPRVRSQVTGQVISPQKAKDAGHTSPSKIFSSSLANGNEKLYEAYNDLHR